MTDNQLVFDIVLETMRDHYQQLDRYQYLHQFNELTDCVFYLLS